MKYRICPDCGAHIDHGERCDCGDRHEQVEQELARRHTPTRNRMTAEEYYAADAARRYRRWLES